MSGLSTMSSSSSSSLLASPSASSVASSSHTMVQPSLSLNYQGCMGQQCSFSVENCMEKLVNGTLLSEPVIRSLCNKLKEQLLTESNVQQIKSPVTVVGDLHGQFFDLIELFKVGGKCPDTNYLFLGDYVDRGYNSVETILFIISMKLRWPQRVTLLRGNHESRQISQVYGFYAECLRKYGTPEVWRCITDLFDYFSIAAVIDNSLFCVHGGLSPSISTIDQIRVLDRFQEIPHEGPISDMMWSDPDLEHEGFNVSQRGAGYTFGGDVVKKFLNENKIEHIVRAHQLCMDGFQILFENSLSTVWSAPNYCYRCGNVAAIMEVSENHQRVYNTFLASPESSKKRSADGKDIPDYFL